MPIMFLLNISYILHQPATFLKFIYVDTFGCAVLILVKFLTILLSLFHLRKELVNDTTVHRETFVYVIL